MKVLPVLLRRLRFAGVLLPLVVLGASSPLSACSDATGPDGCCKICKAGKACGDTCIERSDTCHVGKGCACDG
jgi:hypothetical protein